MKMVEAKMKTVEVIKMIITIVATIITAIATVVLARCTYLYLQETKRMRDIAEKEFKMRDKPMVGVEDIHPSAGIEDASKFGKRVLWNNIKKEFYCDDLPIDVSGIEFNIKIRNFGSKPATKVSLDTELWIDNTLMPKTVTEELGNIIMPTQQVVNLARLNKANL